MCYCCLSATCTSVLACATQSSVTAEQSNLQTSMPLRCSCASICTASVLQLYCTTCICTAAVLRPTSAGEGAAPLPCACPAARLVRLTMTQQTRRLGSTCRTFEPDPPVWCQETKNTGCAAESMQYRDLCSVPMTAMRRGTLHVPCMPKLCPCGPL